jgi:hypothetical protein
LSDTAQLTAHTKVGFSASSPFHWSKFPLSPTFLMLQSADSWHRSRNLWLIMSQWIYSTSYTGI